MSFYGDMTSVSKTHFIFDKIYGNKALMDASAETDGVFAGRFVLVEYGLKPEDSYILAVGQANGNSFANAWNEEITIEPYHNIIIKNSITGDDRFYRGNNGVWTLIDKEDNEDLARVEFEIVDDNEDYEQLVDRYVHIIKVDK